MRGQIREVHDFVADVIRRGQAAGVIIADRDAEAEAWIFVAGGLLATIDHRLGGLLGGDLERVRASRRAWMAPGDAAPDQPETLRANGAAQARRTANERAPAAAPGALSRQAGRPSRLPGSRLCGPATPPVSVASALPLHPAWRPARCKVRSL